MTLFIAGFLTSIVVLWLGFAGLWYGVARVKSSADIEIQRMEWNREQQEATQAQLREHREVEHQARMAAIRNEVKHTASNPYNLSGDGL